MKTAHRHHLAVALGRPFSLATLLLASTALAAPAAPDPVADLNRQYDAALAAMRRPSVAGVLVTEITPESPAGAAGLRAGDIITSYYGKRIPDLQTLREEVAEAVARKDVEDTNNLVVLRARRATGPTGSEEVVFSVPREPLGIRAIEVEAGVPAPRNPPPNQRGTVKLDWATVRRNANENDGLVSFRLSEKGTARADTTIDNAFWLGWMTLTVTPTIQDDLLAAKVVVTNVEGAKDPVDSAYTFRLRLGDYTTTPAFLVETASADYLSGRDGRPVKATATRVGESLKVEITTGKSPTGEKHAYATPLTALVQSAVPLVAAALPHEPDTTLALHLLSVRDFLPRPGYVLTTVGKKPLPGDPAKDVAWRVDLMHCGVIIESYFFSDGARLLAIQTPTAADASVIARRVANPQDAMAPAERKQEPAK